MSWLWVNNSCKYRNIALNKADKVPVLMELMFLRVKKNKQENNRIISSNKYLEENSVKRVKQEMVYGDSFRQGWAEELQEITYEWRLDYWEILRILIGRTDAEAPILWPTDTNSQLTGKRTWCWERLKAGEVGNRGWDGWMASPMQWMWTWANSGRQWGTGKPGVLQSMGLQRVRRPGDWTVTSTEKWPVKVPGRVLYAERKLITDYKKEIDLMCFKNEKKRHVLQLGKEEKMRSSQQLMTNSCQTTACGPNLVCPVFVHSFTGTQSYKFVYRLSMAFSVLQWEIWIAVTQVTWPTKPKIHTFFCLFFFFLAAPCSMRDPSSSTRDWIHAPCI